MIATEETLNSPFCGVTICGLLLSAVLAGLSVPSALAGGPAVTDQQLAKATSGSLTASECTQLAVALQDAQQSAKWVEVAGALKDNWRSCNVSDIAAACSGHWTGQAAELAKLTASQADSLAKSLKALGREDLGLAAVPAWMSAGTQWQQLPPSDLAVLARALEGNRSVEAKVLQASLTEHVWSVHLSKKTLFEESKLWEYVELARAVGPVLSDVRKAHVAGEIVQQLPVDGEAFKGLSILRASDFADSLLQLGRKVGAGDTLATWMSNNEAWKTSKSAELARLGPMLKEGASATATAQKSALVSHLWSEHLGPDADSANVSRLEMLSLAFSVRDLVSAQQKAYLLGNLVQRASGTAALASSLTWADVLEANKVFFFYGDQTKSTELVVAWMNAGDRWKSIGAPGLARMIWLLRVGGPDVAAQQRTTVTDHVWQEYLGPGSDLSRLSVAEMVHLGLYAHPLWTAARKKDFSTRFLGRTLAAKEVTAQMQMADMHKARRLLGGLRGTPAFADFIGHQGKSLPRCRRRHRGTPTLGQAAQQPRTGDQGRSGRVADHGPQDAAPYDRGRPACRLRNPQERVLGQRGACQFPLSYPVVRADGCHGGIGTHGSRE